jgi:hypothetical protein
MTAAEEISKYVRFSGSTGGQMGQRWHQISTGNIFNFPLKGNENHELGTIFLYIR